MSNSRVSMFSGAETWSLFALGAAAMLSSGVLPVLLGTLIESGSVSLGNAGLLATLETIAFGVAFGLASAFFKLSWYRIVGVVGLFGLAVANFAGVLTTSIEMLVWSRVFAGFFGGCLLWIVTSMIVRTNAPERLAGYFMAGYTLVQSLAVFMLATAIVPSIGWKGCLIVMGSIAMLPLVLVGKVPTKLSPLPRIILGSVVSLPLVIIVGVTAISQIMMTMTLWAYLEPVGQLTGASAQTVQLVISASLIVQIVGAAFAGFVAPRMSTLGAHFITTLAIIGCAICFLNIAAVPVSGLVILAFCFSFLWMFLLPFQTKLAIETDESGRLALALPAIQILGSAIAPFAAGYVSGDGPASRTALFSVACGLATIFALAIAISMRSKFRTPSDLPSIEKGN